MPSRCALIPTSSIFITTSRPQRPGSLGKVALGGHRGAEALPYPRPLLKLFSRARSAERIDVCAHTVRPLSILSFAPDQAVCDILWVTSCSNSDNARTMRSGRTALSRGKPLPSESNQMA